MTIPGFRRFTGGARQSELSNKEVKGGVLGGSGGKLRQKTRGMVRPDGSDSLLTEAVTWTRKPLKNGGQISTREEGKTYRS